MTRLSTTLSLVGIVLLASACQSMDTDGATGLAIADTDKHFAFFDLGFNT